LVGIAGEDDLDAPDLNQAPTPERRQVTPRLAPPEAGVRMEDPHFLRLWIGLDPALAGR
jgi:hypothetical protein